MAYVGTDIIEVDRIRKAINRHSSFKNRVYTEREIEYCQQRPFPEQHFAGRFAGKEALKKVLMSMDLSLETVPFNVLEILNRENGKPYAKLLTQKYQKYEQKYQIELSISHTKRIATATAIME